jgi:hypothetical protein
MSINKQEFENAAKTWLERFLIKGAAGKYRVNVLVPESNVSKLAVSAIKKIDGYSFFEFKPDVLGILENEEKTELVFLNRSVSSLSLKEIGELQCYSRLAKPLFSFLTSPKGLASEVALLLLNKETQKSLLCYNENKFITTFKLDPNNLAVEKTSIYPLEMRRLFT